MVIILSLQYDELKEIDRKINNLVSQMKETNEILRDMKTDISKIPEALARIAEVIGKT